MEAKASTDNPRNRMYCITEHGRDITIYTDDAQHAKFHPNDLRLTWKILDVVCKDSYRIKRILNKVIRFITLSWHFEQALDMEALTNCPSGNINEKSAGADASLSDSSTLCTRPQKQHGTLFVSLSIAFNSLKRLITIKF